MIGTNYTAKGAAAAAVAVCYGAWLIWRAITNDVWRDTFGQVLLPRWVYAVSGLFCTTAGLAVILFITWQLRSIAP